MLGVGAPVHHALGVVDVAVAGPAAREGGGGGVREVEHVEPAVAGRERRRLVRGAHRVQEARLLVHDHVVGVAEAGVVVRRGEGDGRGHHVVEPGQVEHLEPVRAREVLHHVGVAAVHLDARPEALARRGRQRPEPDGVLGIAHVHELGAGEAADHGDLAARERIRPAPDVVREARHPSDGKPGEEIHARAGELERAGVDVPILAAGDPAGVRGRRNARRRRGGRTALVVGHGGRHRDRQHGARED
jgi:hypothetical protein